MTNPNATKPPKKRKRDRGKGKKAKKNDDKSEKDSLPSYATEHETQLAEFSRHD
jgi:ubiquitin